MNEVAILLVALGAAPAEDRAFFEARVRPLLVERCYNCHSTKTGKRRGGLQLDSRAAFLKGGDTGPAAVPGRPEQSLLVRAVRHAEGVAAMPPSGALPAREVAVLEEWVRRGAFYPDETAGKVYLAAGRKFWSFVPPRASTPPAVKERDWPRRHIDAFLLAEMERQGLAPSPPADARALIRRVSFDLVGLPPAPEEVDAFVGDRRPDAYERLIERLLASPGHGERWGRSWLDLVRYCDIAEQWFEGKGKPYLYRDWVVAALNADVAYDHFVRLQLAADLMPDARPADLAALGLFGLSPTYWKELKLDKDVIKGVVAEEWEERIHTLGSTFLGLTLGCARCHDHKFDPVTQEDYYALAGVFASSRQADRPLLAEADARRAVGARERTAALQKQLEQLRGKKPPPADLAVQEANITSQIAQIRKEVPFLDAPAAPALDEASVHVLADGPHKTKVEYKPGVPQDVAVQLRGNPAAPGPVVPRRFLAVLSPGTPAPFRQGSGRAELAGALVTEGAPLAARVIVNRVWKHHFGAGLVETPSDFGVQGSRPSHPALLDDLAARFMAAGWSLKWLHREIVLSAAYRQASAADPRKQAVDPDNRLLWRMNRRRLEVEAWRDAMLSVTGSLDRRVGGTPADLGDAGNRRRTLYGIVRRRELNDLLRLHDFPDPTTHSPARLPTTTPLQQLYALNSPFVRQQSLALARRLASEGQDERERVRRAYRLLFGREATDGQVRLAKGFLATGPRDEAWAQYAQALLGSNEFLFVD